MGVIKGGRRYVVIKRLSSERKKLQAYQLWDEEEKKGLDEAFR